MRGKSTFRAEILNVSKEGLWMLVRGEEYFLPYAEYPWFKDAAVKDIYRFDLLHGNHLHWPDLDVDLSLESFRHPERYPLTARPRQTPPHRRAA